LKQQQRSMGEMPLLQRVVAVVAGRVLGQVLGFWGRV